MRDDLWIVLPHLGPGGAQKVALLAAERYQAMGWRVRVVTLLPEHPVVHALPEGLAHLDLGSEVAARWKRFFAPHRRLHRLLVKALMSLGWPVVAMAPWHLWRWCVEAIGGPQALVLRRRLAESRPRSVLSMLSRTNVLCCSALWDQSCHLVVSERNDLRRQALPFPWPRLRRLLYRRADVLTANTSGVLESLARLPCLSEPVLLPNPLPQQSDRAELPSVAERRGFIAVARLVHQKGLDVLIDAFSMARGEAEDWTLTLVGEGPERHALEAQVARLGLQQRVDFLGHCRDVSTWLAAASVFVLPSRFEGMPNALLEAMAQGLAVVVTDASPGPLEEIEQGVNGFVVPSEDAAALALRLEQLASDPALRETLGNAARQRLQARSWSVLGPIWDRVLNAS